MDLSNQDDVRHVARATLISSPLHAAMLDSALEEIWIQADGKNAPTQIGPPSGLGPETTEKLTTGHDGRQRGLEFGGKSRGRDDSSLDSQAEGLAMYSSAERLRHKEFSRYSELELEDARRFLRSINWNAMQRRSRRRRPAPHEAEIDMRRLLHQSLRNWGEILEFPRRGHSWRRRRLVLICDISGSMDRYTRILLQFLHSVGSGFGSSEVFVFSTRLTRISHLIRHRDIDTAISSVSGEVQDWSGGTRIGDAIGAFNRHWARRVGARGAVVVIISDGWDRGDVQHLSDEMRRLQRLSHRLIWLNPLLGSPSYQPLTRGLQAALPHVDDFLPAHNLASLQSLARILNGLPARPERKPAGSVIDAARAKNRAEGSAAGYLP